MKSEKGFSLVELLITVTIIMTLGAIAILYTPNMLASYRVRGATRLIYSDMQMARLKAIKEGKEMAAEFITGNTTIYCIKRKATGAANWDVGCNIGGTDTADEIVKTVNLASEYAGVTINPANLTNSTETANERAAFYPNGTAVGGSLSISSGVRTVTITINTGTGNIRMS